MKKQLYRTKWRKNQTLKIWNLNLIFKQLYTIYGFFDDKFVPLVYWLFSNKKKKTYKTVLNIIKNESNHYYQITSQNFVRKTWQSYLLSRLSPTWSTKNTFFLGEEFFCLWLKLKLLLLKNEFWLTNMYYSFLDRKNHNFEQRTWV